MFELTQGIIRWLQGLAATKKIMGLEMNYFSNLSSQPKELFGGYKACSHQKKHGLEIFLIYFSNIPNPRNYSVATRLVATK